jgi:hypothetical protein
MEKTGISSKKMDESKSKPTRRSTRRGEEVKRSTESSSRDLSLVQKRRLAGLEAAQGLGVAESARRHNLPISTVRFHMQRLSGSPLPTPKEPPSMPTPTKMVHLPNPADKLSVLNAYGVYLSGSDKGVKRATLNNKRKALDEMAELQPKFKKGKVASSFSKVTSKHLNYCINHHKAMRANHQLVRGTGRIPYEYVWKHDIKRDGRPPQIPLSMCEVLEMWVKACRAGRFKVSQGLVRAKMRAYLDAVPSLKHVPVTVGWYYRWLASTSLEARTVRELDITRAQWLTSQNVKTHYDVVVETAVATGLGVLNGDAGFTDLPDLISTSHGEQDFIYGDEHDVELNTDHLRWKLPHLLVSLDETKISTMGKNEKQSKGLADGPDDHGECLILRGAKAMSLMGGIYGDNTPVPPMCVYNSGLTASGEWSRCWPECKFGHNEKGSFNERWFSMYIKEALYPDLQKRGLGVNGQRAMLILDGVITHCSHELILWCHANGIEVILRPPNTSSSTQPEDVILFKVLKRTWTEFKNECLLARILEKGEATLSWEDVVRGTRDA